MAGWQSGHAADCNSVYAGSIPTSASIGKARVVKSVDTGDLKSPAHKACQFESGLGHHSYTSKYGAYKEPSVKLVFLCLQKSVTIQCTKKREHIDSLKSNISFVYHDKGGNK